MFALAHRRDRTRYCEFHNDHNHDTNDCVDLRKEIEMYIRNGWLSHLTRGAKTQNSSQNITPSGNAEKGKDQVDWKQKTAGTKVINEVLMTNKKWSPPCHESRTSPPSISIAFSSNDPIPKHCNGDNPLIIIADIRGCMIHCIYVDGGSSTEIMPGITIVRRDILRKIKCAQISRKRVHESDKEAISETQEKHFEKENVVINASYQDQPVAIGADLSPRYKEELWRILSENLDVFAWSPSDMTGIPRELTNHNLNVHPCTFPIR
ncbi:hypothetical protein Tco_1172506 [Tanacetum coccineum]